MGMPKNLLLVRHGQSEGNFVRKQYEKKGDESFFSNDFLKLHESQYALTSLGVEQAGKAGHWLLKNDFNSFDRMLVSNNVRAMQTAAYLNLTEARWMVDFNLRERDGGLFNTITPSERDLYYATEQKFYDTQPFLSRPPQGESIADVCQRIKIVLDTLARECDGKNVIIVCHGHIMRAFRMILERMSLEKSNEILLTNAEWTSVPNCSIIHYTRENHSDAEWEWDLFPYFHSVRMIRPAGGGNLVDDFSIIERKKYSNAELLAEAEKNRKV
jgi:broad specificity phosphatase PhoE